MSRFKFEEETSIDYFSPQEMYADYKKKKIKGIINYQSEMIDKYMNEGFDKKDVALELPTGSGKTLVGLLIGEFRRIKEGVRVVYVCPNNQLVNQVVDKAINEYGIDAVGFTGSKENYGSEEITSYLSSKKIAVTNYSSIFNINSFFNESDILIFDDSHSSENYIASNWTLNINRSEHSDLFIALSESLKPVINNSSYKRLVEESSPSSDDSWNDLVPMAKQNLIYDDLYEIINTKVQNTNLFYSWENIKDKLNICNIYLSKQDIVIRPYIPPTLKHKPFKDAKQRIYMSATLGISGELERTVGVGKINRISIEKESVPSIGRRLFIFPNAKFSINQNYEIFRKIKSKTPRGLILVERNVIAEQMRAKISENDPNIQLYNAKQLEETMEEYENDENAVAILANRYDGLNLQDDACHFLLLSGLPTGRHLQEKFFINTLSTSVLYNERLKTRITQAVGRCTRSTNDYAVVMIMGRDLENIMQSEDKRKLFAPELRAEIKTGIKVSESAENIDDLVDIANLGLTQSGDWHEIESQIIKKRNEYRKLEDDNSVYEQLYEVAELEVKYQYHMWMNEFLEAIEVVEKIMQGLNARSLGGYRQYWNYIMGSIYDLLYLEHADTVYKNKANEYYDNAARFSDTITWFRNLKNKDRDLGIRDKIEESEVGSVIDRIESSLSKIKVSKKTSIIEQEANDIISLLNDKGIKFEDGLNKLGNFLGYNAENSESGGAPDPWWILNEKLCIVSESKIYENDNKEIPLKDVRESAGHPNWIREHINTLDEDAEILNIFITNANKIDNIAKVQAKGIYYVSKVKIIEFAERALTVVKNIKKNYTSEGSLTWREHAIEQLVRRKVTPKDYIDLIQQYELIDLD